VAAFFDEMSCHGKAHDAETEKSDFSHVYNLGVSPARLAGAGWQAGDRGGAAGSTLETGPPSMWNAVP